MNIKFLGTKVAKLSLIVEENDKSKIKDEFKLSFVNGFPEDDGGRSFIVNFSVTVSSEEEKFILELEYTGFFEADEPITEKFRASHFPSMNAPAIAYPFLRSFVNTITVNSNLKPVLLPTINFQELVKQQNDEENNPSSDDTK